MAPRPRPPSRAPSRKGVAVLVLAAGQGKRLPGALPKVLIECLGLPLLEWVRRAIVPLAPAHVVLVVGHGREAVTSWAHVAWPDAAPVVQEPQHGTGHAARLAMAALPSTFVGDVVVVYGDVPQLEASDLQALLSHHRATKAAATVLTGTVADAGRLGRVVRAGNGRFARIVEASDASAVELALGELNTGIYAFDAQALRPALENLPRDNAQREEYLTDAVHAIAASGGAVETVSAAEPAALLGVNTRADLAAAFRALRARVATRLLDSGVAIVDPDTTVVEADVEIAPGARILPFTFIGHGCRVGADCVVGPFAHLRGGTVLEAGAQVGNFVEVKASILKAGAKAKHLAYLGDADVGEGANVGCGAVTANFDGTKKHRTRIGARARIGSGTILVAPVSVGEGAITGANAVVLANADVSPGETVVGVPARPIRRAPSASAVGGATGRATGRAAKQRSR